MAVTVGARATGRDLRFLQPLYARLASDIVTSSNDVLIDVPGLAFLVRPESRYHLDGYIAYSSASAAGLKLAFDGPAGASPSGWGVFGVAETSGASTGDLDALRLSNLVPASFNTITGAGTSTGMFCMPHGIVRTKDLGGTLQLQFAQFPADASATTIKAGSWLRLTQTPT